MNSLVYLSDNWLLRRCPFGFDVAYVPFGWARPLWVVHTRNPYKMLGSVRPTCWSNRPKDFTELMRKGVGIMQKKLEGMSEQEKVQLKNKSIDEAERMDYLA